MAQNNQPQGTNQQQIQIKISDEILKGVYSNMAQITHTPEEFVVDFMNIFPPNGVVASRVIISPKHMKRILAALQQNIKNYENKFGVIQASSGPEHNIGFRTD